MSSIQPDLNLSGEELRIAVRKEYSDVALNPDKGYHFHTGRRAAAIHGYDEALYADLPEDEIEEPVYEEEGVSP